MGRTFKVTSKNILAVWPQVSKRDAYKIVRLCNETLDPLETDGGYNRDRECYHRPSTVDLVLHAVAGILNQYNIGYGVESAEYNINAIRDHEFIQYVNMGDTYKTTILHNPSTGKFEVSDWGSLYETSPHWEYVSKQDEEYQEQID